ncbi:unnamed protein product [Paramecium pentaurelia]|uniref:Uncharacterized protein n=1 Tax=Paramecium pentaurelia TaxID=43138 RepID=A0A8S1TWM8_9CILI|nr:unnamed protein product [Paramecium pentaurelia]
MIIINRLINVQQLLLIKQDQSQFLVRITRLKFEILNKEDQNQLIHIKNIIRLLHVWYIANQEITLFLVLVIRLLQVGDKLIKKIGKIHSHSNNIINRLILMLNKKEDQLIQAGQDNSIKVWNVDVIKNELNFKYSLDKHSNSVDSFNFNSSETVLISSVYCHFIIWEKGALGKWEFKYIFEQSDIIIIQKVKFFNILYEINYFQFYDVQKNVSDSGRKIYLINDQQLLWVTLKKNVDDILVFEIQNGVFQQNNNKIIKSNNNNECEDDKYFSMIHNKDKNIILVRHKHHIYLISELNHGTFNIMASLNCQNDKIFGTMTNNGQYLVFLDNKYKKYSFIIYHSKNLKYIQL